MWPAGLGACSRQSLAAKGLHADHRADHAAIDVNVAHARGGDYLIDKGLDARMDAEGQAKARLAQPGQHAVELLAPVGADMQHRPEDFRARQREVLA